MFPIHMYFHFKDLEKRGSTTEEYVLSVLISGVRGLDRRGYTTGEYIHRCILISKVWNRGFNYRRIQYVPLYRCILISRVGFYCRKIVIDVFSFPGFGIEGFYYRKIGIDVFSFPGFGIEGFYYRVIGTGVFSFQGFGKEGFKFRFHYTQMCQSSFLGFGTEQRFLSGGWNRGFQKSPRVQTHMHYP